jgi:hypothetical protein
MTPSPEMQSVHRPGPRRAVRALTLRWRPHPGHSTTTTPVEADTRLRTGQNFLHGLLDDRGQCLHPRLLGDRAGS